MDLNAAGEEAETLELPGLPRLAEAVGAES